MIITKELGESYEEALYVIIELVHFIAMMDKDLEEEDHDLNQRVKKILATQWEGV